MTKALSIEKVVAVAASSDSESENDSENMNATSSWEGILQVKREGNILRVNDLLHLPFWLEIDLTNWTARGRLESQGQVNPGGKIDGFAVHGDELTIRDSHVPGVWVKINRVLF